VVLVPQDAVLPVRRAQQALEPLPPMGAI
jgi:hypothetical protein